MVIVLLILGCGDKPPEESAKDLYDLYCGICHGMQGQGYLAPQANALGNPQFLAAATDQFLIESTIYGRPETKMSAWGDEASGPLSKQQIQLIVNYIREWENLPPADIHSMTFEGDIVNGELLYAEHCAICHGDNGEGLSAMSINNLEFLRLASDGFIWHAIAEGREPTTMQSYQDTLTDSDISDLVVLIRSWE